MLILAFDTSGFAGSVALLEGPRVLREETLETQRRSAQTLAPAIVKLLKDAGVEPRQIRLVATTVGPGSFTGLRVGVTTAKTFAYAVGAEAVAISTLEAIACCAGPELQTDNLRELHAVLDAQRKELFLGRFQIQRANSESDELPTVTRLAPDQIIPAEHWLGSLAPGTLVIGSGLEKLARQLPAGVIAAPAEFWQPRASVIGQLAWRDYQRDRRDDLWKLAPVYLRPSYAEEKAAHRSSAGSNPAPGAP